MFTHYAQIEDGQIVAYPVNPRVMDRQTGRYNVFEYWTGGELDGKTYVFCHNREPAFDPHTQNLVEGQPVFVAEENIWLRTHTVVEASDSEKALRREQAIVAASNTVESLTLELQVLQPEIDLLDDAAKQKWSEYNAALLSVQNQSGYPLAIDWPVRPDFVKIGSIGVERI